MSMKKRVVNGLNFIYNSGPQKSYQDGTRHSRWSMVVDEAFVTHFDGKTVPSSAVAEADSLAVFLPKNIVFESISWDKGAAVKIKRISAQGDSFNLRRLNVNIFKNLREFRGGADNFLDIDLGGFDCLGVLSVSGLNDSRLLKKCDQLYELMLWNTDVGKLDSNWLADCDGLRLLEFIECSGFENTKQKMMPAVEFLRVVKPSRGFALSDILKIFPSVRSVDIQGIRMTQIDCELPQSLELFVVNGKMLRNVQ